MAKKSFIFSSEDSDNLLKLGRAWRLQNGTSVLRVSLAVFEDLTNFIQNGSQLIVRTQKGEEVPYHPLMTRFPSKLVEPTPD